MTVMQVRKRNGDTEPVDVNKIVRAVVPDEATRAEAFAAVENIPSIKRKAEFCFRCVPRRIDAHGVRV
jgi:hypothetical protein